MRIFVIFFALSALLFSVGCSHGHSKRGHKAHWMEMDTDKDGAVSKEEFDKAHAVKFKAMDTNNDGKISKDEKKAFFKSKGRTCCKTGCEKCGHAHKAHSCASGECKLEACPSCKEGKKESAATGDAAK